MKKITTLVLLTALIIIIVVVMLFIQSSFKTTTINEEFLEKDFTILLINGSKVKLSSFVGKPILVNFMSLYCKYCIEEIEELKHVRATFSDKIVIISIVTPYAGEKIKDCIEFKEKYGIDWVIGIDEGQGVKNYNIVGVPTLTIFDENGKLIARHLGVMSSEDLISILEKLV